MLPAKRTRLYFGLFFVVAGVGASLLGLSGDEVIHCILDVMYAKAPFTVLQRAVHIHPTVSEFIPTMLGDLRPLS